MPQILENFLSVPWRSDLPPIAPPWNFPCIQKKKSQLNTIYDIYHKPRSDLGLNYSKISTFFNLSKMTESGNKKNWLRF